MDKQVTVPLWFGPSLLQLQFQVLPNLSTPIVLGIKFLETVNPIVDLVSQSVTKTDNGQQHTLLGKKWSNPENVQLVSLESFYQCMRDSVCTGSWKVCVTTQDNSGKINTIQAQKEELVDPKVANILEKYRILFNPPEQLPPAKAIRHQIRLFDEAPLPSKQCQYYLTYEVSQEVKDNIDVCLQCRWIRPSCSQYGHPVLIIRKKDGKLRRAVDYCSLNSKTIPDRFLLPRIDEILGSLGQSALFTKFDLDIGYHQNGLNPEYAHKTAFNSKWGLYEYTILLLGLKNAPAIIQHLMNQILRQQLDKEGAMYLDDITIYRKYIEEHISLLEQILDRLEEYQLSVKRSKYKFEMPIMNFLGHIISANGV